MAADALAPCITKSSADIDRVQGAISVFRNDRKCNYCKTSNISRILVGNKIVDNSDVVGASPVGTAPTTSSFST